MARILLIGYPPPWLVPHRKIEAAHYRTWQFLQPLLEDGHEICLCAGEVGEEAAQVESSVVLPGNLDYRPLSFGRRDWQKQLQNAHDSFQPDCLIAVNASHCLLATKLHTDKPIWMDIYGEQLTIMQAAFYRKKSDRGLQTTVAFMKQILQKGDMFSGCGLPQKHAMVGELAMAGRLNRRTFGYEFVQVVFPGVAPLCGDAPYLHKERSWLATHGIHEDDFVVLWCGGYNTWTDVDTLFQGLEWAMNRNPRLQYVSVGANTYRAPDDVYARFSQMIQQSPHRERFHLLGWQPWSEIPKYYQASDIGINIDALHYETLYGTRTRLVEMIGAGLPVITSTGAELSYLLHERGAACIFEIGDWEALGRELLELAADPGKCRQVAEAAYAVARNELSFAQTTVCVRKWVHHPKQAPDRGKLTLREQMQVVEFHSRALLRRAMWHLGGVSR